MKILLYTDNEKVIGKSGLGKAIKHQMKALELNNISYTTDPNDEFDILHINTYFPASYEFAKKAKENNKKIVYHAHSTEEDFRDGFIFCKQISPIFKKWIIKCYSLGDVLITPTLYSKKLLESYEGLDKKIYAISNGVDIDKFQRNEELGIKFRKKYGFKPTDKVIIGIGLYIRRKGIVDFVELAKKLPNYKFIWFGYSPLSAATKDVRDAVNTKLDNLTFAGYVEPEMIIGAMSGCDLYIFPTLEETEGIPVIEACACRCKMLIRDIPVFDGWLEDGVNVYKAKDIDEFENKIIDIIEEKVPNLTDNAYKIAEERSLANVGKQLKDIYESIYSDD